MRATTSKLGYNGTAVPFGLRCSRSQLVAHPICRSLAEDNQLLVVVSSSFRSPYHILFHSEGTRIQSTSISRSIGTLTACNISSFRSPSAFSLNLTNCCEDPLCSIHAFTTAAPIALIDTPHSLIISALCSLGVASALSTVEIVNLTTFAPFTPSNNDCG